MEKQPGNSVRHFANQAIIHRTEQGTLLERKLLKSCRRPGARSISLLVKDITPKRKLKYIQVLLVSWLPL